MASSTATWHAGGLGLNEIHARKALHPEFQGRKRDGSFYMHSTVLAAGLHCGPIASQIGNLPSSRIALRRRAKDTRLSVHCSASDNEKDSQSSVAGSVLRFLCPLLKLFGGGDAAAPRSRPLEVATSGIASMARLPWGSEVRSDVIGNRPNPPLLFQLYEFEACPFCRRVREALTELDLSAEVYPCPKGSAIHRTIVKKLGGKEQFPYFVDPNTGAAMYESADVVRYLFEKYGNGAQPTAGLLESTFVTGTLATLARAGRGMTKFGCAVAPPQKMIELYSYENNQFARLVREALCELELPYVLRNAGKGSSVRQTLMAEAGSTQVPYMSDPNTSVKLQDSEAIVEYLFRTYATQATAATTS